MKAIHGFARSIRLIAVLLAVSLTGTAAHAADNAAGIYKGSYASYAAGGDHGTVTILVNDQGATTCDFVSAVNGYGTISVNGSVSSTAPYLALSCTNGISNGGDWFAESSAGSRAGGTIAGTWTRIVGPSGGQPAPTGSFEASYVSALTAIAPAAMAGAWQGASGAFDFLPAGAGFVVSFIGWTNTALLTPTGVPVGPTLGSPIWLLSDVGPTAIFPGTPVTLNLYSPAEPTATKPLPSTVVPYGTMSITFLDCHTAIDRINGPTLSDAGTMQMIAGIAGAPGC